MNAPSPSADVVVERRVNAAPAMVYSLLTRLDRWLAWQVPGANVDARPGGAFRMNVAGRAWATGHFLELVPDRRIVLSWQWESSDYAASRMHQTSRVRIDLIPDGEGTLVRLTHSGLPPAQHADHRRGWTFHLGQLASLIHGDGGHDK